MSCGYRYLNRSELASTRLCNDRIKCARDEGVVPLILVVRQVIDAAMASAAQLGLKHRTMVSRAYHDSLFMSTLAPTSMIFIPCKGGVSHRPDEFASADDIERGVKTLALTLARLSMAGLEPAKAPASTSEL